MSKGKTNRNKGHSYERYLAKIFRALGYNFCKTSRQASRLYDNCGIDLWGIPFLIQAKAGYINNRIKPDMEFKNMEKQLQENFPKDSLEFTYPKIIFNKLDGRNHNKHLVSLNYLDFLNILIELKSYQDLIKELDLKKEFLTNKINIENEINKIK